MTCWPHLSWQSSPHSWVSRVRGRPNCSECSIKLFRTFLSLLYPHSSSGCHVPSPFQDLVLPLLYSQLPWGHCCQSSRFKTQWMAWDSHLSTPAPRTPPFAASATPERSKIEPQSKFGQNICILRPASTSERVQLFCSFNLVGLLQCAPLVKWLWHSQSILNWERTTFYSGVCRHDIGKKKIRRYDFPPGFVTQTIDPFHISPFAGGAPG